MVVYAKSYPRDDPETLKAHTETLLEELRRIKSIYGSQIEELIAENLRDYFWGALEISCIAHDLGKIHTPFQNAVREALKIELLPSIDGVEEIPHNILSPAFLFDLVRRFPREIQDTIFQAVAFHHSRGTDSLSDEGWRSVVTAIEKDLLTNLHRLDDLQPLLDGKLTPKSNYRKRLLGNPKGDYRTFFILLKGLLHRIDHSASAHLEIETARLTSPNDLVTTYLQSKGVGDSDIWQRELAKECQHSSVVFQASTGSGKTEFSLYWLAGEKGFYTLPVRTSVNAMYERLKETYQTENVGLLHSDSYFYAIEEYALLAGIDNQNTEGLEQNILRMDLAKQMSVPVTVSTADQLFTAVFKYKGYEKIYATLAYSRVIVDEIQSYDPDMVAIILKGLEDIAELGGKFCLVTATLPEIYLNYIKENIPSVHVLPPRLGSQKKHKPKLLPNSILDEEIIQLIQKAYQHHGKMLIIVNTVKRSQELFDVLRNKLPVSLLHAGFIYKDRRKRENEHEAGSILNSPEGVWITTQLAEVSLDIDFPAMVTELSSIDSQVQRWGRVWRHTKSDYDESEPNIYICQDASGLVDTAGRSLIYDKDLVGLSIQALRRYDNTLLSPQEEHEMIQGVFGGPEFRKTHYYNKFEKSLRLIKGLNFTIETKNEAQRLFRKFASVNVIPSPVYYDNESEIENAVRVLLSSRDKGERLKALYTIKQFTVPLPAWKTHRISLTPLAKRVDVLKASIDYSPKTGIGRTEELGGVIL
ncbi:MAG TPA: CRISPR-associated helicase Cas3' [Bacteroidota bacterium]|nr:CRISPR-associated helicase Cas3' [Bacteroidota bacterium]